MFMTPSMVSVCVEVSDLNLLDSLNQWRTLSDGLPGSEKGVRLHNRICIQRCFHWQRTKLLHRSASMHDQPLHWALLARRQTLHDDEWVRFLAVGKKKRIATSESQKHVHKILMAGFFCARLTQCQGVFLVTDAIYWEVVMWVWWCLRWGAGGYQGVNLKGKKNADPHVLLRWILNKETWKES